MHAIVVERHEQWVENSDQDEDILPSNQSKISELCHKKRKQKQINHSQQTKKNWKQNLH
jgi:hypothetical protein